MNTSLVTDENDREVRVGGEGPHRAGCVIPLHGVNRDVHGNQPSDFPTGIVVLALTYPHVPQAA